jgi:hypothetical protein
MYWFLFFGSPLELIIFINSDGLPSAGTQNKPNEQVVRVMEEGFGFKGGSNESLP